MTLIRVGRIAILNGSDYPSYDSNDIIDAYYDDLTQTVVHKLNDVTITSGDPITFLDQSLGLVAIKSQNYGFCDSTNYVTFTQDATQFWYTDFPYFRQRSIKNDPRCSSATVCDIAKGGTPIITPATEGAFDGSIKVSVTSSRTVKFSLTDVDYNSKQLADSYSALSQKYTITFSNLPAGNYTIYAEDSAGCKISIQAVIGVKLVDEYSTR